MRIELFANPVEVAADIETKASRRQELWREMAVHPDADKREEVQTLTLTLDNLYEARRLQRVLAREAA